MIDTADFKIHNYIEVPTKNPASCGFAGRNMEQLIVVTSMLGISLETDSNAGFIYGCKTGTNGRTPFLFG